MPVLETSPLRLHHGDMREILPRLSVNSVDVVVTDPPYELGFMGKGWDKTGIAFDVNTWRHVLRVMKPGGYMLAMGGSRTYHRLTCAIEDSGFEIRDCLMWLYGTGFPKGQGNLKPAYEPIILARKPGKGVKPLGIDECRVPTNGEVISVGHKDPGATKHEGWARPWMQDKEKVEATKKRAIDAANTLGRYPANVVHDGSDEVLEVFAAFGESKSSNNPHRFKGHKKFKRDIYATDQYTKDMENGEASIYADQGTTSRFFYCAKASKRERGEGNKHPTVKPLALIGWLIKLISRPGEVVLDPFMGSGTTGKACVALGRRFIGIEKEEESFHTARKRIQEQG